MGLSTLIIIWEIIFTHMTLYIKAHVQQNGVAKRKNKHILEVARALIFSSNMSIRLWGDAILTTTFFINRMPSRDLLFNSPLQQLKVNFSNHKLGLNLPLKVFGCKTFIHI